MPAGLHGTGMLGSAPDPAGAGSRTGSFRMNKFFPLLALACGLAASARVFASDAPTPPQQIEVLMEYPVVTADMAKNLFAGGGAEQANAAPVVPAGP